MKRRKIHPAGLVLVSYLFAVAVGAGLLMLPQATTEGIGLLDAVFTATSAICVTGLVVVDTGSAFTLFGQIVILGLIQAGGLGIMTFSVLIFLFVGRGVSFRQRMILQDAFGHTPRHDILRLVKSIFLFTFLMEALGAAALFPSLATRHDHWGALFSAAFHSVSAFCNAGFSLYADSFTGYRGDSAVNTTVCGLIVLGGIGFPVVYDLLRVVTPGNGRVRLSVQTKTVLLASVFLVVTGAVLFWAVERNGVLAGMGTGEALLASVFQSVTARTAGFNTVDMAALHSATLCCMLFLMFVGASPGSCGGGIKTSTFAVLGAFAWSRLRRRMRVNMFHKSIPTETVAKASALVALAVAIIGGVFFLLLFSASQETTSAGHERFLTYLFETVSAFGTVGLSMGITSGLGAAGKGLVILTMLIGRVGVLTFAYVLAGDRPTKGFELAEENVMIG